MAKELEIVLKKAEGQIGIQKIDSIEEEIKNFCEIVGDNNAIYFDQDIFPPGYIMNLTNRVVQQIFMIIGPKFIAKVKGVIHVSSEVKLLEPMPLKIKYFVKINTSQPEKKEGKKGDYYSVTFKTTIYDEKNKTYAIDNHVFFFKL